MAIVSAPENLDTIITEGERFLEFARRDPGRIVPQYPTWSLTDLVTHLASIHARTIAICATLPRERISAPQLPEGNDPFDWCEHTLSAMVEALDEADLDAGVWALIPPHTVSTWERRMVIETGIHRWDAQQAFEEPAPLLPIVASSGLDEFTHMWLPRLGDLPTLEVIAADLDRSWRFGGGDPITSVTGTASNLFLRLMARPGAELPPEWETAVDGLATPAG